MNIDLAIKYLEDNIYPEIGLIREAPTVQPNWFWIWIDNHLALEAAKKHGKTDLFNKLTCGLYRHHTHDLHHGRIESLFGLSNVVYPWRWARKYVITDLGDKKVLNESTDGPKIDRWMDYADLLFLAAIHHKNLGGWINNIKAHYYFWLGIRMWNGVGFKDSVAKTHNVYATYKLALYLIAEQRLGISNLSINGYCGDIIDIMQEKSGGVYTDYNSALEPKKEGHNIDTNCETTALCLLASPSGYTITCRWCKGIFDAGSPEYWSKHYCPYCRTRN